MGGSLTYLGCVHSPARRPYLRSTASVRCALGLIAAGALVGSSTLCIQPGASYIALLHCSCPARRTDCEAPLVASPQHHNALVMF